MKLKSIHILNFRNHKNTNITFGENLNVIFGLNGEGKTTILEALSVCSLSKSFLPTKDNNLIKFGSDKYCLEAKCKSDLNIPYKITVEFDNLNKKKINSSIADNLLPKHIIGEIPIVILSPDDKCITFGSPADRRNFLDKVLSQSNKIYLDDLVKLKKVIKQRNKLLNQFKKNNNYNKDLLNPWTDSLIDLSSEIILRRKRFIEDFSPLFLEYYNNISSSKEKVEIKYYAYGFESIPNSISEIKEILKSIYENKSESEFHRATTLFGPQKDDLIIKVNGGLAREIASQGQHKSLLISIKLAEYDILKKLKNETPIILLDDIFSELDKERISHVLKLVILEDAQTIITGTDVDNVSELLKNKIIKDLSKTNLLKEFHIQDGKVKE